MTRTVYGSKDKVPMRVFTGVKNNWQMSIFNDDGSTLDATGYSYFCQLRDKPGGKLLAELDVDVTDIATGVFVWELTKAESELIGERSGVYDVLQQEDAAPTNVVRLYGGDVEFIPVSTEI